MMERGGCGGGKKIDLKVEASEEMQILAGVGAHIIIVIQSESHDYHGISMVFFFVFLF